MLLIFPPSPAILVNTPRVAPILPTLALPVAFNVPVMFAPVPVITRVVLPTAVMLTLPSAEGIATLEFPLEIRSVFRPVN